MPPPSNFPNDGFLVRSELRLELDDTRAGFGQLGLQRHRLLSPMPIGRTSRRTLSICRGNVGS